MILTPLPKAKQHTLGALRPMTNEMGMNATDIIRERLFHQQLATQRFRKPDEVVGWLGAVQAQDFAGAKWSIGLRLPTATDADIELALAQRTIVRTWPMRGTLHFVAAKDARWMLSLLTPRTIAINAKRHQSLGLDAKLFSRCEKLLVNALRGGRRMSREAVYALLEARGISTAQQRGYIILWRLAQEGLLCFGAREGKQHTFALLDEWLPATKPLEPEDALTELARRYFHSHGPATLKDFVWWSGLKVSDAKTGLANAASELAHEKAGDETYWMSPARPPLKPEPATLHLLPGFDEYLLGYADRSAVLDARHVRKVCPANAVFSPTILIDGRVAGTWRRAPNKGKGVSAIAPTFFASTNKRTSLSLAKAAEKHVTFLGQNLALSQSASTHRSEGRQRPRRS